MVVVHGYPPVGSPDFKEDTEIKCNAETRKLTSCELSAPEPLASTKHRGTTDRDLKQQGCSEGSVLI